MLFLIPISYFEEGVPSEKDLVISGTDKTNGITNKEKLTNGGMLITVEKSKYNDLLDYTKEQIINYCNMQTEINNYTKVEHNNDFSEIIIYQTVLSEEGNLDEMIPATSAMFSYDDIIAQESIYYQALLKKTDTENIICKVKFLNSDTNELLREYTYSIK